MAKLWLILVFTSLFYYYVSCSDTNYTTKTQKRFHIVKCDILKNGLSDVDMQTVIGLHYLKREEFLISEGMDSKNLSDLVWDERLAKEAEYFTKTCKCNLEHAYRDTNYSVISKNSYSHKSTFPDYRIGLKDAVGVWFAEKQLPGEGLFYFALVGPQDLMMHAKGIGCAVTMFSASLGVYTNCVICNYGLQCPKRLWDRKTDLCKNAEKLPSFPERGGKSNAITLSQKITVVTLTFYIWYILKM